MYRITFGPNQSELDRTNECLYEPFAPLGGRHKEEYIALLELVTDYPHDHYPIKSTDAIGMIEDHRENANLEVFGSARRAVSLVAGRESGINQRQFYSDLVSVAKRRYLEHLESF